MDGPIGERARASVATAPATMTRVVVLVLAIAALGFTIVSMHAMHGGSISSTPATVQAVGTHAFAADSSTGTAAAMTMPSGQQTHPATGDRAAAPACTADCLAGEPGPGHGMAMLCLSLLPAAALFALRLLRRLAPSSLRLQIRWCAVRSVTGYRRPPRPRPTLATLCILRT